eukprot:g426.t1
MVAPLCEKNPDVFPSSTFTREALMWAHGIFFSRALLVPIGNSLSPFLTKRESLVPLVDSLNHRAGSLTMFESNGTTLSVRAANRAAIGQQMYINYGTRGNSDLLLHFGFAIRENPVTHVTIDLSKHIDRAKITNRGLAGEDKSKRNPSNGKRASPVVGVKHVFSSPRSGSSPRGHAFLDGCAAVVVPRHKIYRGDADWSLNAILLDSARTIVALHPDNDDDECEKPRSVKRNAGTCDPIKAIEAVYGVELSTHDRGSDDRTTKSISSGWDRLLEDLRSDDGGKDTEERAFRWWDEVGCPVSEENERRVLAFIRGAVREPLSELENALRRNRSLDVARKLRQEYRGTSSISRIEASRRFVEFYIEDLCFVLRRVDRNVKALLRELGRNGE